MLKKKRVNDEQFCEDLLQRNFIRHMKVGSAFVYESFWGDEYLIKGETQFVTQFDKDQLNASQLRED